MFNKFLSFNRNFHPLFHFCMCAKISKENEKQKQWKWHWIEMKSFFVFIKIKQQNMKLFYSTLLLLWVKTTELIFNRNLKGKKKKMMRKMKIKSNPFSHLIFAHSNSPWKFNGSTFTILMIEFKFYDLYVYSIRTVVSDLVPLVIINLLPLTYQIYRTNREKINYGGDSDSNWWDSILFWA